MAKDVDEIRVAANGLIHVGPLGTTAPTDTTTAWDAGWIDLGYASEDGVSISKTRDVATLNVWQSFFAARRVVTSEDFRVSFNLTQWNYQTVPLAFGGGTITDTAGAAPYTYTPPAAGSIDERAVGIEWVDGTVTYRLVIARAMVTENVETQLAKASMSELPITLGVIGEEGVDPFTIITDDPAFAAA